MTVERIATLEEFERIRGPYEGLYRKDPSRGVFVSWEWLRSYFAAMRGRWTVLAVARDARYVGFCVLVESGLAVGPLRLYRELALGAYPTADYGALIAEEGEDILEEIARAIDAMPWDLFRACNVHDPRVGRVVAHLRSLGNGISEEPRNCCRFVPLPASWEEYAARNRSGDKRYVNRRRNLWRGASLVEADATTVDEYIETLLRMHHRRWRSNLHKARRTYGKLFREAYERGCCRIAVLWSADRRPLAAQAAFVDAERRSWGVYMLPYDRLAGKGSPGIGMLAKGLERAIDQGFAEYDFLRGDEPYTARFGTQVRLLENYVARRTSARSAAKERAWGAALHVKSILRRVLFGRTL